jgi:hypothetical protein
MVDQDRSLSISDSDLFRANESHQFRGDDPHTVALLLGAVADGPALWDGGNQFDMKGGG